MVFFALQDNNPINAQDIHGKIKTKFVCCDPECNSHLSFIDEFSRTIKKNTSNGQVTVDITVSSHFKHITDKNSNGTNACSIENFINSIGDTQAREFYRFWTNFFTYESIKNTFNSESKFHVLCENIMIHTSSKELTLKQIKNKEYYAQNNEKVIWILDTNESVRQEIKREIIRRKYWDNGQVLFLKYYIVSDTNYYYDFELFDYTKSDVYLDIGANKLLKLVGYTFQGFEVEPIEIKTFLNLFKKIIKPNVTIPTRQKLAGSTFYIHNEVLVSIEDKYDKMKEKLNQFKKIHEEKLTHGKSQKYHIKYIELEKQLKAQYNIDYCENIQNKIYINKSINKYSTDCLKFIWQINEDNYNNNIISMTCSVCNINYQGNILVENICNECIKFKQKHSDIYETIINDFSKLLFLNYQFDFYVKLWKLHGKNFFTAYNLAKLNKLNLCETCIGINFKCLTHEKLINLCTDCDIKNKNIIYNNIKTQIHNVANYEDYDKLCEIFLDKGDNFIDFIKKTDSSKNFLCDNCICKNYNLPSGQYKNLCLICQTTQEKKKTYDLIINEKASIDSYSFDELVTIWNLNSKDFYYFFKKINPQIENHCNNCVIKYFYDKQNVIYCDNCIKKLYEDITNNKIQIHNLKNEYPFKKIYEIFNKHADDFNKFYSCHYVVCECHIKEHYSGEKFVCDKYESLVTYINIKTSYTLLYNYKKTNTFEQMENIFKTNGDNFFNFYKNNYCQEDNTSCVNCVKNHYYENFSQCKNCNSINVVLPLINNPYSIYNLKYTFDCFVKMFEIQGRSFIKFINKNFPKTINICLDCISLNFNNNLLNQNLYAFPLSNLCAICKNHLVYKEVYNKNHVTCDETYSKNHLVYKEIYTRAKKDKKTYNEILKDYNFDELVKIWCANNDDFYCHLKIKYCLNLCESCLRKKFYDNKYCFTECAKCKILL